MMGQASVTTLVGFLTFFCSGTHAFVVSNLQPRGMLNLSTRQNSARYYTCGTRAMRMEAEELEQLNPAIKGKKLEIVDEEQGVWKYEFDIEAPGPRTQSLNDRILNEIKKKSDFPGYRKGEIPPRLMPEANKYVIEEIMNDCLLTAMDTYDLVGAEGDGSEANINTDIEEMLKVFKPGKPLSFTCTFDAKPKSEAETSDSPAVDATMADTT